MDTVRSFKGYGKVDPVEEEAFRSKTRKRVIIIIVSVVFLLAVIIGAIAETLIHKHNNNNNNSTHASNASLSIIAVCSQTLHPESCYNSISEINKSNSTDPEELMKLSLQVAYNSLADLSNFPKTLEKSTADKTVKSALTVCQTVLNDAVEYVQDCISSMDVKSGEKLLTMNKINDMKTWLSTAITNLDTCLNAFEEINSTFFPEMKSRMRNSTEYASNSLAIVSKLAGIMEKLNIPIHRKLLTEMEDGFPGWVSPRVRRLLQEDRLMPNVTVAGDGTGDVETINEAMAMVKKNSESMFVIYIKEGVYEEKVVLDKSLWNVMIYGDGKDKSIVSGDLNYVDGVRTFNTSTFGNFLYYVS